jgi:hypothetical protein
MNDELVTLATFDNPVQAAMARNYLEAAGIRAYLLDEQTVAMHWGLSNAIGGVKLQVKASSIEEAEALLDELPAHGIGDVAADDPALATAITTPETLDDLHEEVDDRSPKDAAVDRIFAMTVIGLVLWPLQFFALWMLLSLGSVEGRMTASRSWKLWASVLLNIPLWVALLVVGVCLLR